MEEEERKEEEEAGDLRRTEEEEGRKKRLKAFGRENRFASTDPILRESKERQPAAFWLPASTPEAKKSGTTPTDQSEGVKSSSRQKPSLLCFATDPPHPISLKKLRPVGFGEDTDSNIICPSCRKTLRNASKPFVLTKCSHTACQTCLDKLVKKSKKCPVCDESTTTTTDDGWIEIKTDGTGFAAGGKTIIAKKG